MRHSVYVVTHGSYWMVKCEHCTPTSTVTTQAEAIRHARAHVASQPAGTLSQILVQGQDGKFRTEWTYGQDPFPPRG